MMNTVAFSSWNGKVVDNRKAPSKKKADEALPLNLGSVTFGALMGWNGMVVDPKRMLP
jgi:hypothetical protein